MTASPSAFPERSFSGATLQHPISIATSLIYTPPVEVPHWFHVGDFTVPPHRPIPREPKTSFVDGIGVRPTDDEDDDEEIKKRLRSTEPHVEVAPNETAFDPTLFTVHPHTGTPSTPQRAPAPLPNADEYREFSIPSIRRRMTAKTRAGQKRFHERRASMLQQRKLLYAMGEQLLEDEAKRLKAEAEARGEKYVCDFRDYTDRRDHCAQCGATFFERKDGSLRCRDCHWTLREAKYRERLETEKADRATPGEYRSAAVHVNEDGLRETTVTFANDVNRVPVYRAKYDPRTHTAEQVKNHHDFPADAARNFIQMTNAPVTEVAEMMGVNPNTLSQQMSRGNDELRRYGTNVSAWQWHEMIGDVDQLRKMTARGGMFVSVALNGRTEAKHVGEWDASHEVHLRNLLRHQKATLKDALKHVRRQARTHNWTALMLRVEEAETRRRVENAYRQPREMFQTAVEEGEGTTVTLSPNSEEGRV